MILQTLSDLDSWEVGGMGVIGNASRHLQVTVTVIIVTVCCYYSQISSPNSSRILVSALEF
jgi:hypothetical protein